MKRLLWLLAVVALLTGSAFITAAPVAAAAGACTDGGNEHTGIYNTTSNISASRSGVKADINVSDSDFDICNSGGTGQGPSMWVSIEPKDNGGDSTKIIQLGIVECRWLNTACQGENNPHFFWAYGGCAPYVPIALDLGPANTGTHELAIYLMDDDMWYFNIDGGAWERRLPSTYLGCWLYGMRAAGYFAERLNHGDSIGSSWSPSYLTDAYYGRFGLGWFKDYWNPLSYCPYGTSTMHCQVVAPGDAFRYWSEPH